MRERESERARERESERARERESERARERERTHWATIITFISRMGFSLLRCKQTD